jgi:hypothetical protein
MLAALRSNPRFQAVVKRVFGEDRPSATS